MVCLNLTENDNHTLGGERAQELFEEVSHVIYGFMLPAICVFGMVGNVLNLTILTRRKLQKSFRTLEQAANLCLISLAVSDLMFCIFAFPTMFLPKNDLYDSKGLLLTYRVYNTAVINVFIMISTWLTVAMSLERYLAICHPLRQDLYLTTRRIKIVIVLTYILSFVFNIPVLWRYEVQEVCPQVLAAKARVQMNTALQASSSYGVNEERVGIGVLGVDNKTRVGIASPMERHTMTNLSNGVPLLLSTPTMATLAELAYIHFRPIQVFLWDSSQLDTVYRSLWALVGNLIPLVLLIYFNVCLCRKIYRSYKMRQKFKQEHHNRQDNSSHVITVTLVAIVLMFLILVAPSEIVIHAARITNTNNSYTYMTVEAVMNFMQGINFSVNFILYCIISPYFRKTLKYIFCCGCYNIYQVSKQWKKEFETSLM
ncbi:hypothetical protein C0Q70_18677 [Pomacea canaliculata]|uniref:G-protein coupled receptors family 1 profile domain-containing protein n=1 Tax=Pomacea canaliculata TaxID=400727 RepID=A0A2T7NH75_POMCA|nr:hypothetical protein C0Q70_18677 [Pomacea canaliculata]